MADAIPSDVLAEALKKWAAINAQAADIEVAAEDPAIRALYLNPSASQLTGERASGRVVERSRFWGSGKEAGDSKPIAQGQSARVQRV